MVVEDARLGTNVVGRVVHASFQCRELLRQQVAVGLVSAYGVVQLSERRHSQRRVVRRIQLPVGAHAVAHVYARVDLHVHVRLAVLHRRDAG